MKGGRNRLVFLCGIPVGIPFIILCLNQLQSRPRWRSLDGNRPLDDTFRLAQLKIPSSKNRNDTSWGIVIILVGCYYYYYCGQRSNWIHTHIYEFRDVEKHKRTKREKQKILSRWSTKNFIKKKQTRIAWNKGRMWGECQNPLLSLAIFHSRLSK